MNISHDNKNDGNKITEESYFILIFKISLLKKNRRMSSHLQVRDVKLQFMKARYDFIHGNFRIVGWNLFAMPACVRWTR
jgi:hypothetical protein